jgi:uncharacterized protein (DUF2252 family)
MAEVATPDLAPWTRWRRATAALARLTAAERAERGKQLRVGVPRESHAEFARPSGRPDPLELLRRQGESRVRDLVPVRYGRMLVSPFSYYRGAALPMASDLAGTPVTGIVVQACGDAHLSNFGLFGTPERNLIFDINDFDETLPGPWEWDVKRLAASLEVAARENGYSRKDRRAIVAACASRYRQTMRQFATMSNLAVWYADAGAEEVRRELKPSLDRRQKKVVAKGITKAQTRDSMQAVRKLTRMVDGEPRIIPDPPLIVPLSELLPEDPERAGFEAQLDQLIVKYRRSLPVERRVLMEKYTYADMARKVVGVGSVGTRCWIVLFTGRGDGDPLLLQVKEAPPSALSEFAGPPAQANQGHRVVVGQRILQAAGDVFLGWLRATGLDGGTYDFYVRQLRDWKFSFTIETMAPDGLRLYGETCAWTLAKGHARSGDRIAIASYLGNSSAFDDAITEFASAYADQNERDYAALGDAVTAGQITAARVA